MKWYRIASERANSTWWDSVLAPLREFESAANSAGEFNLEASDHRGNKTDLVTSLKKSVATRNTLEDMELETRALTEPLPTNQQVWIYYIPTSIIVKSVYFTSDIWDLVLSRPIKTITFTPLKDG